MTDYTVGEVAALAHVTVRTLHHYDALGLLPPSTRSAAGYRLYSSADLRRLRQILFYRELEFGLDEIAQILADPSAGTDDHLRRQHGMLRARQDRDQELLRAIEKEMEARKMGIALTPQEQFEIFGTDKMDEYTQEARQRWGNTDAWSQSQRRTASYTKTDWITIKSQADDNIMQFAAALTAGEPAASDMAMDLAEEHRQHLCRWFFDCDYDMHRSLAELYVSDPAYMETYDQIAPGFSQYVRAAIFANADRAR